jgi:hypothetical protein
MYPFNAIRKNARRIMIIIAAMIISHGIPLLRFFAGARRVSANPLLVAVTLLPLPYRIPTPGTGFFFHELSEVHL